MIDKRLLLILAAVAALVAAGCQNGAETKGSEGAECSKDADCATAGCSGQLCVPSGKAPDIITTCEYKDEYDCLKLTNCACVSGRCNWIENPDYGECVKRLS